MKVWTVWEGSYSDREMLGIFSTEEKAWAFLDREKIIHTWCEVDDSPIEYEIDSVRLPEKIDIHVTKDGEVFFHGSASEECIEYADEDGGSVVVSFNPDRSVMEKAARDRLAMLKAREAGI